MMKRIYALGLFLTLLLGIGFQARAEYTVTFEWDTPGSVKIDHIWGYPQTIPPGATSITLTSSGNWDDFYVLSADGYILEGATCEGENIATKIIYSTETIQIGNAYNGKTVKIKCVKPQQNDSIDIYVENGLSTLTVTSFTGAVIDLQQGENTVPFNPDVDNPLTVKIAGEEVAYRIALNNQTFAFNEDTEKWEPEAIQKINNFVADYNVTMAAGDELFIQPLAPGTQEKEICNFVIDYGTNMAGCVTMIVDHSTTKSYLPDNYEDGVITGIDNLIEGAELKVNFLDEDYTITKLTLNGVDITSSLDITDGHQSVTFIVDQENTVLEIEGRATVWNDITYTGYVSDPENVLFGLSMDDDSLNYTEIGNCGGQTFGTLTMPEGSKEIQLTVSEKNNHGMGTFYFKPKEGYFITVLYVGTPNDSESNGTKSINSAIGKKDDPNFYMIVEKMDPSYTANLKVVDSGYHEVTQMRSSGLYTDQNDNPAQQKIDIPSGDSTITFVPNYDNPYTIYFNQNTTGSVYLDGAEVTGTSNSDTNQTEYVVSLFAPAVGETSDVHSDVQVWFTGSPAMANATLNLENGAKAEFFYSPVMHPVNGESIPVIAGTVMTVKPTGSNAIVLYKGEQQQLDANGEFRFTTSSAAADNTVTVTLPKPIDLVGLIPSNGSTVKTLKKFTIIVPGKDPEETEIIMDMDSEKLSGLTVTNRSNETVATIEELGEGGMVDGNITCPVILNTTITEAGTYYINIPAGAFVQKDDEGNTIPGGYATAAYSGRLKVDPNAQSAIDQYTLAPEDGTTVEEISEVKISFSEIPATEFFSNSEFATATFTKDATTINGAVAYDWNSEEEYRVMKVTPVDASDEPTTINEAGDWTLTLAAGTFVLDGEESPVITAVYKVTPSTLDNYTLSPADGTVKALSSISVTFPNATTIEEVEGVDITLVGPEYNANASDIAVASLTKTVHLTFPAATIEGDYTLTIPAGAFTLDGEASEEILAHYTLKTGWVLSPTSGETVESLNEFILAFPEATDVEFVGSEYSFNLKNFTETYAAPRYTCEKDESAEVPTFKLTLPDTAMKPVNGEYKFRIEEGTFTIDGEESPEINAVYTLDAEVSSDYILSPDGYVLLPSSAYEQIIVNVLFDEAATVTAPSDSSQIKMTIDGIDIPSTAIMSMAENNFLMIGVMESEYYKTGILTLEIPAGAFKVGKEDSPAISGQWEVVEPKTYEVEISAANGNQQDDSMSDMSEIILHFPGAKKAEVFIEYGARLSGPGYNQTATIEIIGSQPLTRAAEEGVSAKLTFDPAPSQQGNYNLFVMDGTLTLDGVQASPEINQTYIYDITTGLWTLFADEDGNVTVFTLDGKVVLDKVPAAQLRELEKGLYIINGKKTLVK